MIVALFILLNVIGWGTIIYLYRRDYQREQVMMSQLLDSHYQERKCDQERIDSLVEALANSKGVPYVTPSRGYSDELVPTPRYFDKPDQRYWDVPRPIVEHVEEAEEGEETN